jgi:hypothetical protein
MSESLVELEQQRSAIFRGDAASPRLSQRIHHRHLPACAANRTADAISPTNPDTAPIFA